MFEFPAGIKLIDYGTTDYDKVVALRYRILRRPLNLHFTAEQLEAEKGYFHIGYFLENQLIACLMLVPEESGKMKMKQVAVDENYQGKGYGSALVKVAEEFSRSKGYTLMYCHARDTAVHFYECLNYSRKGNMFEEVTIPHWEMEKQL